jgi:Tfp pilus assembly protein PilE
MIAERSLPRRADEVGTSLLEVMLVLTIVALMTVAGIPSFLVAHEQSKADRAGVTLHSIWVAQRMHWLERRDYADSLSALANIKLIEGTLDSKTVPYTYSITSATETTFLAEADRSGSTDWTGSIYIDEGGALTGSVLNGEGRSVTPIAP